MDFGVTLTCVSFLYHLAASETGKILSPLKQQHIKYRNNKRIQVYVSAKHGAWGQRIPQ